MAISQRKQISITTLVMCVLDHGLCISEQPFSVAIWGKINTIGHCIWIVQNMIVDSTFMEGVELSCESLDVVLGETVTEIIWCQTYYPLFDKMKPGLSTQTSTMTTYERCSNSWVKTLHYISKYWCNSNWFNCDWGVFRSTKILNISKHQWSNGLWYIQH